MLIRAQTISVNMLTGAGKRKSFHQAIASLDRTSAGTVVL